MNLTHGIRLQFVHLLLHKARADRFHSSWTPRRHSPESVTFGSKHQRPELPSAEPEFASDRKRPSSPPLNGVIEYLRGEGYRLSCDVDDLARGTIASVWAWIVPLCLRAVADWRPGWPVAFGYLPSFCPGR